MKVWWGVAAIAVLILVAYDLRPSKLEVFGQCRLEAVKAVSSIQDTDAADSKAGDYTMLCMESKGYELDFMSGGCKLQESSWTAGNRNCYYRPWPWQ